MLDYVSEHSDWAPPPRASEPLNVRALAHRQRKQPGESAVLKKLGGIAQLSETECALIGRMSVYRESISAGGSLWRPGQTVGARIILKGWACRERTLPDGRRQIFGFLMPGDTIGLNLTSSPLEELSTVALTRIDCMDALLLREILQTNDNRHARLQEALRVVQRDEEACLLDHIMRLGRQSALERTAHFFLEIRQRTQAAGLADGESIPLPVTQEVLADALGLSIVHLNRTLQSMKRDGLIEMRSGGLRIVDLQRLEAVGVYGRHDH
jgi:CRP-like cAMP-binding protein